MTDELLRALGRHQREDLAKHSDGEASVPAGDDEDELARPLDEGERAQILDGLFDRLDGEDEAPAEAKSEIAPEPKPEAGGQVIELDSRRRRTVIVGTLVSAAAAAALIFFGRSLLDPDPSTLVASVPDYTITSLEGGSAAQRSAPEDAAPGELPSLELRADDEILWVLTPSEPTHEPVAVAALARSEAGEQRFVPRLEVERSGPGALRLRGPLSSHLELDPGVWTIELFVAEPEQLPRAADESERGPWRRLEIRVTITAE